MTLISSYLSCVLTALGAKINKIMVIVPEYIIKKEIFKVNGALMSPTNTTVAFH